MAESFDEQNLILIIDDNVDVIRLLNVILKDEGQLLFATSGEAGVQIALERRPQLILLDVDMPGMDGYEVCHTLKIDCDSCDSAIIFVTAYTNMENEVRALDAGAADFITKPLNPRVVVARVRTHLELQRRAVALVRFANKDTLTGLFTRHYFDEILEKEFQRHQRQKLPLGIVLVDVDYFKAYSEGYGAQAADFCLKTVADAINSATRRPGEIVARYTAEKFVVLLPYTSLDEVQSYGAWIGEYIRQLVLPHQFSVCADIVTISVGISAVIPDENYSTTRLIEEAENSLLQGSSKNRSEQ